MVPFHAVMRSCSALLMLPFLATAGILPPPLPAGWLLHDAKPAAEDPMPILMFLNTLEAPLTKAAVMVSDPASPDYGSFLRNADLKRLVGVPLSVKEAVERWLSYSVPLTKVNWGPSGDTLHLHTSVQDVERIFSTEVVRLVSSERTALRAGELNMPVEVMAFVGSVFGTHGLPLLRQHRLTPSTKVYNVTPEVLRKFYGMVEVNVSRSDVNRRAVAEFQSQFMDSRTLKQFFERYVKGKVSYEPGVDDVISKFVEAKYEAGDSGEATLDVEYLMGVSPGVKTEFWEQKSGDFCGDIVNWTEDILASPNPPLVHSVSYGMQGNLSIVGGCSDAHVAAADRNFQKLAARGITIIFSSGDAGSAQQTACSAFPQPPTRFNGTVIKNVSAQIETCCSECSTLAGCGAWNWDYAGTCTLFGHDYNILPTRFEGFGSVRTSISEKLWPAWPGSSPWVTVVGATRFIKQQPSAGEMASDTFGSGGGFSPMFTAPPWQQQQIKHFFDAAPQESLPPTSVYYAGGRAAPDVCALGEGYQVWTPGTCNKMLPEGKGYKGTLLKTIKNVSRFGTCCQSCPAVPGCRVFNHLFDRNGLQVCDFFGEDAKIVEMPGVAGAEHPSEPFVQSEFGTSASTPLFAGMISLINEVRIAHGKKPLGFLNPWLYMNAAAFTDITQGTNAIDRDGNPLKYGWTAGPGWDPVTGLGSPKFEKLLAAALREDLQQIVV